jgi:tetratricopeptide (TPR) repeat protein
VSKASPYLVLGLLAVACFTLATMLQSQALVWSQGGQDSMLKLMLGESRQVLAGHLFTKADVYFHSGYYPSIFDRGAPAHKSHMAGSDDDDGHEDEPGFLGPAKDLFERIGRHSMITQHTHLQHGNEREILPWLKLSAELDPHHIDTYTVAAYWLANRLGKVPEAEQFLREGLRANPNSFEILFALGRIYLENSHDPDHARNVWEIALRRWREQEPGKQEPNNFAFDEITVNLARLEEQQGNFARAIEYLELAKTVSPAPEALEKQIKDLKQKLRPPSAPSLP